MHNENPATAILPPTVNMHILGQCNYGCRFCYARFETQQTMLPIDAARRILDLLRTRGVTRVTFAGGEPTLHPGLPEMLAHASRIGLITALVTNGSLLDLDLCRRIFPHLRWLVLSCDSHLPETCEKIGRKARTQTAAQPELVRRICALRELWNAHRTPREHVQLKINIVVTTLNADEDPSSFLAECAPSRIKLLKCTLVPGENDDAGDLVCTRAAFETYAYRLRVLEPGITVVAETEEDIFDTYAMIGPNGGFRQSRATGVVTSAPILDVGLDNAWADVGGCDIAGFARRGGVYDSGIPASGRVTPIIALEGLDGCGKSTTASALATRMKAALVTSPPRSMRSERVAADALEPRLRRAFYLRANNAAMDEANHHVFRGTPVIMDRSIASTLAYGAAERGTHATRADLPRRAPIPDHIMLLDINENVRRDRHSARHSAPTAEENRLALDTEFRNRVVAGYRALATSVVDANGTVEQTVERVVSKIPV